MIVNNATKFPANLLKELTSPNIPSLKVKAILNSDVKKNKLFFKLLDSFYINNIRFYDYNATIELILDKYRGKLLSMKYV